MSAAFNPKFSLPCLCHNSFEVNKTPDLLFVQFKYRVYLSTESSATGCSAKAGAVHVFEGFFLYLLLLIAAVIPLSALK